ncbi:MAG TPA: 2-oxoglutarate dehydrogenase complex dihydrolipoyllysine-residue succinyltransferase [Chitinophagales bacterium]|jgi:2-oxoglutarate dehydrogenase E2 component (dihydrolipoamide succinyltransferase)|nr:2-oxoglutarate dehydrogenase complex dihydrolipoyllysine-residue succinyltransferase [Chitinophagales bacterium]HQW78727.1 2-oxoglutarate dehydrogenase complex dihydrolipoyllysine-residue succinyltransferase [Chitinophagales bacterium]
MAKVEIKVPSVGESVTEVTLSSWLVEDGDYVKLDQSIAEFESDKATFEMPSEAAGIITRVANEGDDIKIGGLVAYIDTDAAAPEKPTEKIEEKKVEEKIEVITKQEENLKSEISNLQSNYATGTPSPAAKKILDEKGIDTSDVNGTGVDGRITKEDALKSIVNSQQSIEKKVEVAKETIDYRPSTADFSRSERVEKMTRMRKTISRRLVAVKNQTAMLTTFNEVDMTRIHEIRAQYKKSFEEQKGIGLGFMSFFTKACAIALQKFPAINAYIDDENIIYHDFCDISIAVSTPKGLVVPVIRNTESMSFAEIEKDIKRLALLGRDGNLTLEDMEGGTFTITNGGVFGSLMSTPIINQPQSAILGMHKIQDRPMAINGKVEIRPMMYLALSYDHRIVDGKESVGFLVMVKDLLENPEKMLFAGDPVKTLLEL